MRTRSARRPRYAASTGTRPGSPNQVPQLPLEVDHVHPDRVHHQASGLVMYS